MTLGAEVIEIEAELAKAGAGVGAELTEAGLTKAVAEAELTEAELAKAVAVAEVELAKAVTEVGAELTKAELAETDRRNLV